MTLGSAASGTSGESVASLKLGADFENMNGTEGGKVPPLGTLNSANSNARSDSSGDSNSGSNNTKTNNRNGGVSPTRLATSRFHTTALWGKAL